MSTLAERGARMNGVVNAFKKYALWFVVGLIIGSLAVTMLSSRIHASRLRAAETDYFERAAAVESRSQQLAGRIAELENELTASVQRAGELRNQLTESRRTAEQLRIANNQLRESINTSTDENNRLRESLAAATDQLDGIIGAGNSITKRVERITELVRALQSGSGEDD